MNEELKQRIKRVSVYTDQREISDLRNRIMWMDTLDPKNREIIQEAKNKNII